MDEKDKVERHRHTERMGWRQWME